LSDAVYLISSFGFKHGLPDDADYVFDVRCLSNPYWVDEMRALCGLDKAVDEYVFADKAALEYLDSVVLVLKNNYRLNSDKYKNVYIGCTGGQHRSVAFAERLYKELCNVGIKCRINHREYERFKK